MARKRVVALSGTESVRPCAANRAAGPLAAAAPVHPVVSYSLTVEPASAEPFTSGASSLAGEPGTVAVITGAAGALASTVNDRETSALSLPAASMAFTAKLCGPFDNLGAVNGETHALSCPESIRQANVEPASLEAREKLGVGSLMSAPWWGPALMLAAGAVASAVNAR